LTRTTAHLISHTLWDREWYMPYGRHHVLLAKLMNELLEILEKDEYQMKKFSAAPSARPKLSPMPCNRYNPTLTI